MGCSCARTSSYARQPPNAHCRQSLWMQGRVQHLMMMLSMMRVSILSRDDQSCFFLFLSLFLHICVELLNHMPSQPSRYKINVKTDLNVSENVIDFGVGTSPINHCTSLEPIRNLFINQTYGMCADCCRVQRFGVTSWHILAKSQRRGDR